MKEFNNPKECVDRLEILLRNPLNRNKKNMTDPIWWLRGSSNNEISSFERLDSERFLMDGKQLKVKKIVVYSSLAYYIIRNLCMLRQVRKKLQGCMKR